MVFHGGMSPRDDVSNGIGGKQKRDGWLNPFQWVEKLKSYNQERMVKWDISDS